jgi:hypothetical protein
MAGTSKAFDMSKMAIGGIGQMLDSVEFVKRAWSSLNASSPLVPTVDIEELDKRIADLKAVEQWLNLNLSMLRGTIQGLEIQRGTLAAVGGGGADNAPPRQPRARPAPADPPVQPPTMASTMAQAAAPTSAAAAAPEPPRAPGKGARSDGPGAAPAMPGINPGAWWNLLQQNFNQVAEAAMSGVGLQNAAVDALKAGMAGASKAGLAAVTKAGMGAAPKGGGTGAKRTGAGAKRAGAGAKKGAARGAAGGSASGAASGAASPRPAARKRAPARPRPAKGGA